MKTIKHTYRIRAPLEDVWQALVDPQVIRKWGAGPATMDDKEGTQFKLWGGDIYGTNKKVIPQKKLVQEWYDKKWDKPSLVTFTLQKKEDSLTVVDLLHQGIPDSYVGNVDDGWIEYYMEPLKKVVEKQY